VLKMMQAFMPAVQDVMLISALALQLREPAVQTEEEYIAAHFGVIDALFYDVLHVAVAVMPLPEGLQSSVASQAVEECGLGNKLYSQLRGYGSIVDLHINRHRVISAAGQNLDGAIVHYLACLLGAKQLTDPVFLLETLSTCVVLGVTGKNIGLVIVH
jgi:hypothetical protein